MSQTCASNVEVSVRDHGPGLYVSRHIVELHGGEIHAEFPDEGGTRIRVQLPIAHAADRGSVAAD